MGLVARGAHPLHEPGGMERAVYHLATQLRRQGHDVVLFTRPRIHDKPFPGEVVEIAYERVRFGSHGGVLDRTLNYPGFARRVGAAIAARVRRREIDVVDAQGMAVLGYLRLRRKDAGLRAPVVVNPQGMEEHKTRGLKRLALTRLRWLSRETARLADRIVSTDDVLTPEIPRCLGVAPDKVVLLRNGVDLEEIAEVTPQDATAVIDRALPALGPAAAPVLISVGRLERYKGFADVLSALVRLQAARRLPQPWAWVILGDGSLRAEMQARIAAFDAAVAAQDALGPHIHFAGWVRDLPLLHAYYERADAFLHATHYEGSSIVTLEAMAHSLPVVATRAGGIPDKVQQGVNGYLVEPKDVGGLAEAIARICASAEERRCLGSRSRQRVEQLFSWSEIARQTVAVYEALIAARAEAPAVVAGRG